MLKLPGLPMTQLGKQMQPKVDLVVDCVSLGALKSYKVLLTHVLLVPLAIILVAQRPASC